MIGSMTNMGSAMPRQPIATDRPAPSDPEGQRPFSVGVEDGPSRPATMTPGAMPAAAETPPPPPAPPSDGSGQIGAPSVDQMGPPNSAALFQGVLGDAQGPEGNPGFNAPTDPPMAAKLYGNAQSAVGLRSPDES